MTCDPHADAIVQKMERTLLELAIDSGPPFVNDIDTLWGLIDGVNRHFGKPNKKRIEKKKFSLYRKTFRFNRGAYSWTFIDDYIPLYR